MSYIKIYDGVFAEEADNPKRIITLEEINIEISQIQLKIQEASFLSVPDDASIELQDAITIYNEPRIAYKEQLKERLKEQLELLNFLMEL